MTSFLAIVASLAFLVSAVEGACTCIADGIRYSSTSDRIYVESSASGCCATLTDIYNSGIKSIPLNVLDDNMDIVMDGVPTGKWLLSSELYVEDGSTLEIHNEELYILSDKNTPALNLRAHGGNLSIYKSKIYGWNYDKKEPDSGAKRANGRAYISCISEIITDLDEDCGNGAAKNTMGECRMDIIDSEIGYLGYQASESYGLTYKVRGYCADESNPEVFDMVQVTGDIKNSDIHHMWFGLYTYGHEGGVWTNNKMHDNWEYGFDPHDDSDNLDISDNEVWNNGNHGIIASKRCNNVKIMNNKVWDGGNAGIFLHRSSDDAEVAYNTVYSNADAGLAIMESFNLYVHDNTFSDNKYGVRISVGGGNNKIMKNTFEDIWQYTFYTYQGSDAPYVPNTTGRPIKNRFIKNTVKGDHPNPIYLKEADRTFFKKNNFNKITTSAPLATFIGSSMTKYMKNKDSNLSFYMEDSCFKKFNTFTDYSAPSC